MSSKVKDNMGYVRYPLLNLEPKQCIPDFLHMKKGVINRLLNQVLYLSYRCMYRCMYVHDCL